MCVDQNTGKYVFTSDGYGVVNLWEVNLGALDASDSQDGAKSNKVERYSTLLEEGMGGEEFVDITNFFYYSQLRVQGEDTSHPRSTPGKVPLSEVPYLMKALGYYLSEGDKQIMRSDVLFQQAIREGRDADCEPTAPLPCRNNSALHCLISLEPMPTASQSSQPCNCWACLYTPPRVDPLMD